MKVKTSYTGSGYITAGKEYEVQLFTGGDCGAIIDDKGDRLFIVLSVCAHINEQAWEVVQ